MNAARKRPYGILVSRTSLFEFVVEAKSAEDACKTLQRDLRSGKRTEADGIEAVEAAWANAGDKEDAWYVMPVTVEPGETHTLITGWNGKTLFSTGLAPVRRQARDNKAISKNPGGKTIDTVANRVRADD
jgi:hypothetical protein